MHPSQKFLTGVGSIFCHLGWIGLSPPYMVLVWKISPKNVKFSIFPLWVKKISSGWVKKYRVKGGLASYLLRVKSKLGSGQGPSLVEIDFIISNYPFGPCAARENC